MKKIVYNILLLISLFLIVGCSFFKNENNNHNNLNNQKYNNINNNDSNNVDEVFMKAIINGEEYIIDLESNETVKSFINTLPQELNMRELNGNEKYAYLNNILPINQYNPKKINAGDVMLYGNNCIVIFYKSFDTSYSYTKIGHISKLPNLGNDNVLVKFEKIN